MVDRYDDEIDDLKKSTAKIWNENLLIPDLVGEQGQIPEVIDGQEPVVIEGLDFNNELLSRQVP